MTTAYGYDVSYHQDQTGPDGLLAYTPPANGRVFLIARATFGTVADWSYRQHVANAERSGMEVGAYHFGYRTLGGSIKDQVAAFRRTVGGSTRVVALDVEGSDAMTPAQTQEFINRMRDAGMGTGLYMSESPFYREVDADWRWVANYGDNDGAPNTPPRIRWDIWQYTSKGHVSGYTGRLDFNQFRGTREDFRNLGLPKAPDSSVETPMQLVKMIYTRGVVVAGGHGIFSRPVSDSQYLIRNTKADETLPLLGNDSGFQVVDPDGTGGTAGYVASSWAKAFVDLDVPAGDCTSEIQTATSDIAAERDAAEAEVARLTSQHTADGVRIDNMHKLGQQITEA